MTALVPTPALTLPDPDSRLLSIAIDGSSSDRASVFVAWSEVTADGRTRLNVTRYREVAGTLGEGAAIITGLHFAQGASAPIAVDGRGLLYVAVPAPATDDHGMVLRFTRDGFVPEINLARLTCDLGGLRTANQHRHRHRARQALAGRKRSWLAIACVNPDDWV